MYLGCPGSTFSSLCPLFLSSFLMLSFLQCPPFVLICGTVIFSVSTTKSPVCISLLTDARIKRGCLQMYGTWSRVSGAAERMCPAWHGPQIYGVDVFLHLWDRDEKIPLFSLSHKHSLHPERTSPLLFLLFLSPSCVPCWFAGEAVGLTRVKTSSSSCVVVDCVAKAEKRCCVLLEPLRPLHNMSDQSSRESGDPLGDRFWLSPKKGKFI